MLAQTIIIVLVVLAVLFTGLSVLFHVLMRFDLVDATLAAANLCLWIALFWVTWLFIGLKP